MHEFSRAATLDDLKLLLKALNERGALDALRRGAHDQP